MFTREITIRVGYKDTDAMGIAHHANYAVWYEAARTEALRSLGISYREMEERGVMMPVLELEQRFLAPARYDDLLTIRITLKGLPRARCEFYHEIFNERGELLNTGSVRLAFVAAATRRAVRAPEWFVAIFEKAVE